MKICRQCIVSGRVQGVFYRSSVQHRANELGISGWAYNLPDGSVEVMACGREEEVNMFCEWLWTGSKASDVSQVICEEKSCKEISGFKTG